MKTIEVSLDYQLSDDSLSLPNAPAESGSTPFPFRVVDAYGSLLAEGSVDSRAPKSVSFDDYTNSDVLFVRLLWPTGKEATQVARFEGLNSAKVSFSDENVPADSWARWAAPRVFSSKRYYKSQTGVSQETASLARFKNVWLRLWHYYDRRWAHEDALPSRSVQKSDSAVQLELILSAGTHLLQLGGQAMPFVFVSLPGGGPCRVLLTPNLVASNVTLPLKVVVTGFRPKSEMLAEFLARDSLQAAKTILEHDSTATALLHEKFDDPVSAIVGAYYLLRSGEWRTIPVHWFDNLYRAFPWSADAALIRCVVGLRRGLKSQVEVSDFIQQLGESFDRGMPLFEEAHRLNGEASSLLQTLLATGESLQPNSPMLVQLPGDREKHLALLKGCYARSAARAWTGSWFSFFGVEPGKPTAERVTGGVPVVDVVPSARPAHASRNVGFSTSEAPTLGGPEAPKPRRRGATAATYLKDL